MIVHKHIISYIGIALLLSFSVVSYADYEHTGADGPPKHNISVAHIPNAVPKPEVRSRYGNPESYVIDGKRYYVKESSQGYHHRGIASWYGTKFQGRRTSSGTPYNMFAMTAAHKSLPLPTYVKVTNLNNGRSVIVKVNDRGPFKKNRIIDLSYAAAKKLGMLKHGTAPVYIVALTSPSLAQHAKLANLHRYIQVGAFRRWRNAQAMVAQIKSFMTQLPVIISQSTHQLKPFYRVQIGPLAKIQNREQLITKLHAAGFTELLTVMH